MTPSTPGRDVDERDRQPAEREGVGFLSIFRNAPEVATASLTAESYSDCECYGQPCDCDGTPCDN